MKVRITRPTWIIIILLLAAASTAELGSQWWIQTHTPALNYSQIEDGLWMGGRLEKPPPGTHAVLNLSKFDDTYRIETYNWQPVVDGSPAPTLAWLREQVLFIDAQRRAGRIVYVHCDAGNSRSGMVMVAYFMWRSHWPRDQALAFLRTKRPSVRPNPSFMELLAEWEKSLAGEAVSPVQ